MRTCVVRECASARVRECARVCASVRECVRECASARVRECASGASSRAAISAAPRGTSCLARSARLRTFRTFLGAAAQSPPRSWTESGRRSRPGRRATQAVAVRKGKEGESGGEKGRVWESGG
eukprot:6213480-Pleurochrysis_carterae.AAC.4